MEKANNLCLNLMNSLMNIKEYLGLDHVIVMNQRKYVKKNKSRSILHSKYIHHTQFLQLIMMDHLILKKF